jgi:hypothetical protein
MSSQAAEVRWYARREYDQDHSSALGKRRRQLAMQATPEQGARRWPHGSARDSAPPGASASATEKLRSLCAARSRTTSPCPAARRAARTRQPGLRSAAPSDRPCPVAARPAQAGRALRVHSARATARTMHTCEQCCQEHWRRQISQRADTQGAHFLALVLCGDMCHVRWRAGGRARRRCGGCSGSQQGVQWSRHACSGSRRAPSVAAPRAGPGSGPAPAGRAQQGAVDSRAPPTASMCSSHQTTSACAVPAAVAATCTPAGMQPSQRCPAQAERLPRAQRMRHACHGSACRPVERAGCWAAARSPGPAHPGRGVRAWLQVCLMHGLRVRCTQDGTKRSRAARLQVGRPPAGGRGGKVEAEQPSRLRQRPQRGLARLRRGLARAGRRGVREWVQVARARAGARGEARRSERRAVLRAQGALGARQVLRGAAAVAG